MTSDLAHSPRLTVPTLMDEACVASGLADWGEDQGFAATLELLLDSCRDTANLTPGGWAVMRKVALRHLRNRLSLQAVVSAHPNVASRTIGQAVVITGLPRTGTTLLHNLLALDPANRVLRFWEALCPVPSDATRTLEAELGKGYPPGQEQLVAQAEIWLERLYSLSPDFRSIHSVTAEGPEECDALLQNSFTSQHFDDMFQAESYSAWLNRADLSEQYRYFGLQLQVLTRPREGRRTWVLKSPGHLGYIDNVARTFAGSLIVHCHRDVAEAVASYASLITAVRSPHTAQLSPASVGQHVLNRCSIAMARCLQARDTLGEDRFVDVSYGALVNDPLAVVVHLYGRLGRPLHAEARAAMVQWLADNPQHKHGRHRYTLSTFGLTASRVDAALGDYGKRFEGELGHHD